MAERVGFESARRMKRKDLRGTGGHSKSLNRNLGGMGFLDPRLDPSATRVWQLLSQAHHPVNECNGNFSAVGLISRFPPPYAHSPPAFRPCDNRCLGTIHFLRRDYVGVIIIHRVCIRLHTGPCRPSGGTPTSAPKRIICLFSSLMHEWHVKMCIFRNPDDAVVHYRCGPCVEARGLPSNEEKCRTKDIDRSHSPGPSVDYER